MAECLRCEDRGYVCENHPDRPWLTMTESERACDCGAGMPCSCCPPIPEDGTHSITDAYRPGCEAMRDG